MATESLPVLRMEGSKDFTQSLETSDPTTRESSSLVTEIAIATEEQPAPDDTAAEEMPPGGKPRSSTVRREADLSSLLNPGEKAELTTLVTRVTESMLKQIIRLFDPVALPAENNQPSRVAFWSQLPYHLKDMNLSSPLGNDRASLKENVKPGRSKKVGRAQDNGGPLASAAETPVAEEREAAPRLQELKKEALQHFRKWQLAVHRRISEISVKKAPDAHPSHFGQASFGPRGRPAFNKRGKSAGMCRARVRECLGC